MPRLKVLIVGTNSIELEGAAILFRAIKQMKFKYLTIIRIDNN